MNTRKRKAFSALAIIIAFSVTQVYVQGSLPNPAPGAGQPQKVIVAKLATKNNQPITVNGNSVATGGSIPTGAAIETPDQVSATIDLGDAGVVTVGPNSKIQLDFDANGNVHVTLIRGCATTRKTTNVLPGEMEISTGQASEKTSKDRKHMGFCALPNGQLGPLTSAFNPQYALWGGAASGAVLLGVLLSRGGNTSQSTPR